MKPPGGNLLRKRRLRKKHRIYMDGLWGIVSKIHAINASRMIFTPSGRFPLCVPTVGNVNLCEKCGGAIQHGLDGVACPSVPVEFRWDILPEQN